MKKIIQTSAALSVLFSSYTFSANPIPGLYIGFIGGGNSFSTVDIKNPFNQNLIINNAIYVPADKIGSLTYNFGGNFGGQLGYRINNFRLEGEFDYAYSTLSKLEIFDITLRNKKSSVYPRLGGSTAVMSGFFNGYYDFYTPDADMNFIPYIGLGIGYTHLQNTANLSFNDQTLVKGSNTNNSGAIQGIFGFSYFLDDFTSAGIDFRYLTTNTLNTNAFVNQRFSMGSINLNLNFALAS